MIRNRYPQLLQQRRQRPRLPPPAADARPPSWELDYYHFKGELAEVAAANRDIQTLLDQYHVNPTVFNLRALDRLLTANCNRIGQVEAWVSRFPFSSGPPAALQLERNLVRHFQSCVLGHINALFLFRSRLAQLEGQPGDSLDHSSVSRDGLNRSVVERGQAIREVGAQIEALGSVLRKMGDLVATQGDLVNRIDENLGEGVEHVSKGRELLQSRAQREEGQGEFSCEGRVNKAIVTLYVVNVVLIFVLVLKNL